MIEIDHVNYYCPICNKWLTNDYHSNFYRDFNDEHMLSYEVYCRKCVKYIKIRNLNVR